MGLFLSEHKYIYDLLKFHLQPVHTTMVARTALTLLDCELLTDVAEYRSMVDVLQYLAMTRSDIVFAVHVVSQFMHAPRTSHLSAVKRIFF